MQDIVSYIFSGAIAPYIIPLFSVVVWGILSRIVKYAVICENNSEIIYQNICSDLIKSGKVTDLVMVQTDWWSPVDNCWVFLWRPEKSGTFVFALKHSIASNIGKFHIWGLNIEWLKSP